MITVFGIPNCDTCRKARKWLEAHSLEYRFHDLREDGLTPAMLERWSRTADWETLLNTRSRTWREIPASEREPLTDKRALELMLKKPTLVKRPVTEYDANVVVGFSPALYEQLMRAQD